MKGSRAAALTVAVVAASWVMQVAPAPASAICVGPICIPPPGGSAGAGDWTRYLHDGASSSFADDTLITPDNAALLAPRPDWPVRTANGSTISVQPIVAGGMVYWGSWNGIFHATPVAGEGDVWQTSLGLDSAPACGRSGIVSTADLDSVAIPGGGTERLLFVGGGGNASGGGQLAQLYALNPATGAIQWHTPLGRAPNVVVWSSPILDTYSVLGVPRTSVYIGLASNCDMPLVQGAFVQLDAYTGAVQNIFQVVPPVCTGGAVWGSPTLDPADGSIYVPTGNPGGCVQAEPYSNSLLKLRAADLTLLGNWQVPAAEQVPDGDFGSAPTLFTGTVTPGGAKRSLVGIANKNGLYYVFDRSDISAGPVARVRVALGSDDVAKGGSIAPSAYDGKRVYVAGSRTVINSVTHTGSVRAFDPNDFSTPLWVTPLDDGVPLSAVTAVPGLAFVGEGPYTVVVHTSNGAVLLKLPVANIGAAQPSQLLGPPSVSQGVVYEGDSGGRLYAYSVGGL